jgi:excisionase family DNA binding protein
MAAQAITSKENSVSPTPRLTRNPYEAAEILGIGHNQVRQLVRAGELPTLPGRNVNIPLVAIERYLERLTGSAN